MVENKIKKAMNFDSKMILGLVALAMMAYGLVYAPMKQLEVAQGNLLINNQQIQLDEAKDIKICQALAEQQLALSLEAAQTDGTEVSEADKEAFAESVYLNCLSYEARDYIVEQIQSTQEVAAEETTTEQ